MKKIGATILSLSILIMPMMVYGAGLIPCGDIKNADGVITNPCGFYDLIKLANSIIKFLMYDIAIPLATLGFMYVGANFILNQNKEGARSEAKESFLNMAKGFGMILGAYVLIKTVLVAFLACDVASFVKTMLDIGDVTGCS